MASKKICKLKGVVQHYSWGGFDFIPSLLNIENKEHQPFAEYWLGAHPNHPSKTHEGLLNEMIESKPEILGDTVAKKFSSLPYLLKILDVRQMLSIQVHPSKEEAKIGFEEENKKEIPVNAFNRNYKDQNHKPEAMVALSDFYLLHGFKKKDELKKILDKIPELNFLKEIFSSKGYKGIYEEVMLMEQGKVNAILKPLIERVVSKYHSNSLQKDSEDFWAARAAINFCKNDNYDRGIFSIYLFNLLHLKKGEGIFQSAGLPHAYLEGQNVEVMANSDNVLRAGLTDKYIDVNELMKHVQFEETIPNILKPHSNHKIFSTPAEEFELQEYELEQNDRVNIVANTAEIFLLIEGKAELKSGEEKIVLQKGDAVLIAAGSEAEVKAASNLNLFRTTVPS